MIRNNVIKSIAFILDRMKKIESYFKNYFTIAAYSKPGIT